MTNSATARSAGLGFLTVVEDAEHGLFGGYLVLNLLGRPLEFHCTAPIKPNRAQEILYGPTLVPYLYGEQIGQTLVGRSAAELVLICTDRRPMLAVREFTTAPVVLVETPSIDSATEVSDGDTTRLRLDGPHVAAEGELAWGPHRLRTCPTHGRDDPQRIVAQLAELPGQFDLVEPFSRIREAIQEAKRTS